MVVDVVSGNASYDLWNLLRFDEMFPAYSAHVGDDTRGQKGRKVRVILVHGYLRDVLGCSFPGSSRGLEVTGKTFFFVDADLKLSHVVRQRVCVQDETLNGTVRVPYPGLPIQLVRVKFFEKVNPVISKRLPSLSLYFVKVLIRSPVFDRSASKTNFFTPALGYFLWKESFSRATPVS